MQRSDGEQLKSEVRTFWNRQSCDTQVARAAKFSREYFDQIEAFRYFDQPFIHSFAQFSRYRNKKVLEVGVGAGTDFLQWLRGGARLSGIDLTEEAVTHVRQRIEAYRLPQPESLQTGDAENLPFPSDSFDLGYSFGVLHHSPDTVKALGELVRVVQPGGEIKVMLYNRHSVFATNRWVKFAVLKGRPWKSRAWVLWHYLESPGTKAYTRSELGRMLARFRLERISVDTVVTSADHLSASALPPLNWFWRLCLAVAGHRYAWHPSQYVTRTDSPDRPRLFAPPHRGPKDVLFTGNFLGFYHCIIARKAC